MALTYKEVSEILKIIDSSSCDEIVLELEGTRLVVRRSMGTAPSTNTSNAEKSSEKNHIPNQSGSKTIGSNQEANPKTISDSAELTGSIIRSPMVGTFYQSPSPDEAPFVKTGSKIRIGDPLCLIEVMKLYTTVESTINGTINSILADDGALVQFDQPLFSIKPE